MEHVLQVMESAEIDASVKDALEESILPAIELLAQNDLPKIPEIAKMPEGIQCAPCFVLLQRLSTKEIEFYTCRKDDLSTSESSTSVYKDIYYSNRYATKQKHKKKLFEKYKTTREKFFKKRKSFDERTDSLTDEQFGRLSTDEYTEGKAGLKKRRGRPRKNLAYEDDYDWSPDSFGNNIYNGVRAAKAAKMLRPNVRRNIIESGSSSEDDFYDESFLLPYTPAASKASISVEARNTSQDKLKTDNNNDKSSTKMQNSDVLSKILQEMDDFNDEITKGKMKLDDKSCILNNLSHLTESSFESKKSKKRQKASVKNGKFIRPKLDSDVRSVLKDIINKVCSKEEWDEKNSTDSNNTKNCQSCNHPFPSVHSSELCIRCKNALWDNSSSGKYFKKSTIKEKIKSSAKTSKNSIQKKLSKIVPKADMQRILYAGKTNTLSVEKGYNHCKSYNTVKNIEETEPICINSLKQSTPSKASGNVSPVKSFKNNKKLLKNKSENYHKKKNLKDKQTNPAKDKQTNPAKDKQTNPAKDPQTNMTKNKQTNLPKDKQTDQSKRPGTENSFIAKRVKTTSVQNHVSVTDVGKGLFLMTFPEPDKELNFDKKHPKLSTKSVDAVIPPPVKNNLSEVNKVASDEQNIPNKNIQYGKYIMPPVPTVVVANYAADANKGDFYLSSVFYQNESTKAVNSQTILRPCQPNEIVNRMTINSAPSSSLPQTILRPFQPTDIVNRMTLNSAPSNLLSQTILRPLQHNEIVNKITVNPVYSSSSLSVNKVTVNPVQSSSSLSQTISRPLQPSDIVNRLGVNPVQSSSSLSQTISRPLQPGDIVNRLVVNPVQSSSSLSQTISRPLQPSDIINRIGVNPAGSSNSLSITPLSAVINKPSVTNTAPFISYSASFPQTYTVSNLLTATATPPTILTTKLQHTVPAVINAINTSNFTTSHSMPANSSNSASNLINTPNLSSSTTQTNGLLENIAIPHKTLSNTLPKTTSSELSNIGNSLQIKIVRVESEKTCDMTVTNHNVSGQPSNISACQLLSKNELISKTNEQENLNTKKQSSSFKDTSELQNNPDKNVNSSNLTKPVCSNSNKENEQSVLQNNVVKSQINNISHSSESVQKVSSFSAVYEEIEAIGVLAVLDLEKNPSLMLNMRLEAAKNELLKIDGTSEKRKGLEFQYRILETAHKLMRQFGSFQRVSDHFLGINSLIKIKKEIMEDEEEDGDDEETLSSCAYSKSPASFSSHADLPSQENSLPLESLNPGNINQSNLSLGPLEKLQTQIAAINHTSSEFQPSSIMHHYPSANITVSTASSVLTPVTPRNDMDSRMTPSRGSSGLRTPARPESATSQTEDAVLTTVQIKKEKFENATSSPSQCSYSQSPAIPSQINGSQMINPLNAIASVANMPIINNSIGVQAPLNVMSNIASLHMNQQQNQQYYNRDIPPNRTVPFDTNQNLARAILTMNSKPVQMNPSNGHVLNVQQVYLPGNVGFPQTQNTNPVPSSVNPNNLIYKQTSFSNTSGGTLNCPINNSQISGQTVYPTLSNATNQQVYNMNQQVYYSPETSQVSNALVSSPATCITQNKIVNQLQPLDQMYCAVCNKVATLRCKQCAKVAYCNTSCAKTYWHKKHKVECRPT